MGGVPDVYMGLGPWGWPRVRARPGPLDLVVGPMDPGYITLTRVSRAISVRDFLARHHKRLWVLASFSRCAASSSRATISDETPPGTAATFEAQASFFAPLLQSAPMTAVDAYVRCPCCRSDLQVVWPQNERKPSLVYSDPAFAEEARKDKMRDADRRVRRSMLRREFWPYYWVPPNVKDEDPVLGKW